MNDKNNVLNKRNIIMYAKKIRDIQTQQIDPFIELIEKHLVELYPELENKEEDGAKDWACDIINSDSNTEVIETLERIENIIHNQNKNKWVCCICGENTYDVDCDNLFGKDHISCVLKEEMKAEQKSEQNKLNVLKEELGSIKEALVRFETKIKELEFK